MDSGTITWFGSRTSAKVWCGRDEPWLRRWLGISEFWELGSIYTYATWSRELQRFMDVLGQRTPSQDATYRTSSLRCVQKRGCMTEPLLALEDRCRWVQCILHCLMAIGRLICTFIDERIDDLSTPCAQAILKILRVCRVRWWLGTKPNPTGEGTWRLMLYAWPIIVDWLNLKGSRSDHAVTNMCWLLCRLYSTWRNDKAISWCVSIAREFRKETAPTSASHYLLFLETVCPTLLPELRQFGLGIFCQDSAKSLNQLIKTVFLTLTNRGGSTQCDDTLPRNTSHNMHSQSIALRQCLQCIFLYFYLPVFKRGETRWHESANQECLKELEDWFANNESAHWKDYDSDSQCMSDG